MLNQSSVQQFLAAARVYLFGFVPQQPALAPAVTGKGRTQ